MDSLVGVAADAAPEFGTAKPAAAAAVCVLAILSPPVAAAAAVSVDGAGAFTLDMTTLWYPGLKPFNATLTAGVVVAVALLAVVAADAAVAAPADDDAPVAAVAAALAVAVKN